MINRNSLISYALDFASFLLDNSIADNIRKIILFGSVARADYTEKSDIDIFIDSEEKYEAQLQKILVLFKASQAFRNWALRGVKNELSLKVGVLDQWSSRREIISSGILLYGKYSEMPKNSVYSMLICIKELKQKKFADRVKLWRALYGYKQKVGEKTYFSKGLIEANRGKKIGKAVFIIPMEQRQKVIAFLNKNKVSYTVKELWMENR